MCQERCPGVTKLVAWDVPISEGIRKGQRNRWRGRRNRRDKEGKKPRRDW